MSLVVDLSDIEIRDSHTWGYSFVWECPTCHTKLTVVQYGGEELSCDCGVWELTIKASLE